MPINWDKLAGDEPKKKGIDWDRLASESSGEQQPQEAPAAIEEAAPKQTAPNAFQLGLNAVGQAGSNYVQGAAEGMDNLVNAGAKALSGAPGSAQNKAIADFLHVKPDTEQTAQYDPVYQQMVPQQVRQSAAQGMQSNPNVMGFIRGAGQAAPTTPAFELGAAMAAPKMLSLAKPAIQATGPVGGALIAGLQKMGPQGQEFLGHLAQNGVGGALAGMQQSQTEEMLKQSKKNPVLRLGLAAIEGASGAMAMGVIAKAVEGTVAGGIKTAGKIRDNYLKMTHDQAVDRMNAQHQALIDQDKMAREQAKRTYDINVKRSDEQMKAEANAKKQAEAERKADEDAKAAYEQAQAEEEAHRLDRRLKEAQRRKTGNDAEKQAAADAARAEEQAKADKLAFNTKRAQGEYEKRKTLKLTVEKDREKVEGQAANWMKKQQAKRDANQPAPEPTPSAADMYAPSVSRSPQQIQADRRASASRKKLSLTAETPEEAPVEEQAPPVTPSGTKTPGDVLKARLESIDAGADSGYAKPPKTWTEGGGKKADWEKVPENLRNKIRQNGLKMQAIAGDMMEQGAGNIKDDEAREVARQQLGEERAKLYDEAFKAAGVTPRSNGRMTGVGFFGSPQAWHDAAQAAVDALKPESRKAAAQTVEHVAAWTQKTSDVLNHRDPALAVAMAKAGEATVNLEQAFKGARSKVKLALQKSGVSDSKLWVRALKGTLSKEEEAALTDGQKEAVKTAQKAIADYRERVAPVRKWLEKNTKDGLIANGSGLSYLRETLDQQDKELVPTAGERPGTVDAAMSAGQGVVVKATLAGKSAVSVYHAFDKLLVMAAEDPTGLTRALKTGFNSDARKFASNFLGESIGPISEAAEEDFGIKIKSGIGKAVTGQYIEKLPNATATYIGAGQAAKELGYKSPEALMRDLNLARDGKGPLAHDDAAQEKATQIIQDYVSDLTGLNVPGFRDSNILQRNKMFAKFNMFTTAQMVQARNGQRLARNLVASKTAGEAVKNLATLGAYTAGLYLVAGDKAPLSKEGDLALRTAAGAPNYYHFMDAVHGARVAIHADQLPEVTHVAPSFNPLLTTAGSTAIGMTRDLINQASGGSADDKAFKIAKLGGIVGSIGLSLARGKELEEGGTIGGKMGVGVLTDYAKSARDVARGWKMEHAYGTGILGSSQKEADIPREVTALEEIGRQGFGLHMAKDVEFEYNAQKSHDLKNWVKDNADGAQLKEFLDQEKDLKEAAGITDLQETKDEMLQELYDAGYSRSSDKVKEVKDRANALMAHGDREQTYWRQRALLWQRAADAVQDSKRTAPAPSSKPEA